MFLLLKKRDGYQRQPPRFIQLFPLRTTLIIVFLLCTRLEKIVHVCLHGVDHPHLLFEPCAFIVEPLLFFQKLLLLRLQCLQARQLFFSLHGKQCASRRLKDHKLRFVLCLEARLILRLLEGVIHGLEPLIVGDILYKRLDFTQTCFHSFQFLAGAVIKEKMDLDIEVSKLKLLKANHLSQKYALEDAISKGFPKQIAETQARIAGYGADIATVKENTHPNGDGFSPLTLAGVTHADKKEAGAALLTMCQTMLSPEATQIGSYRGLTLELAFDTFAREYRLTMIGQLRHTVTLGTDVFGNLQRMDNALEGLPIKEQACREQLSNLQTQLETAKAEVQKPFPREEELNTKTARLEELNTLLNLDHKEPEIVDAEPDEDQRPPERRRPQMER